MSRAGMRILDNDDYLDPEERKRASKVKRDELVARRLTPKWFLERKDLCPQQHWFGCSPIARCRSFRKYRSAVTMITPAESCAISRRCQSSFIKAKIGRRRVMANASGRSSGERGITLGVIAHVL